VYQREYYYQTIEPLLVIHKQYNQKRKTTTKIFYESRSFIVRCRFFIEAKRFSLARNKICLSIQIVISYLT